MTATTKKVYIKVCTETSTKTEGKNLREGNERKKKNLKKKSLTIRIKVNKKK